MKGVSLCKGNILEKQNYPKKFSANRTFIVKQSDQLMNEIKMTLSKSISSLVSLLMIFINNHHAVLGLQSWCYDYYSEFSLDQDYNPTIYPEVNTTITDITTLYKISEVSFKGIMMIVGITKLLKKIIS